MKYLLSTLLLISFVVAGCAGGEDSSELAEAAREQESDNVRMLRPDANNPVNENLEVPLGWEFRFDDAGTDIEVGTDPDSSDVYFVTMKPGWHTTTHRASGIFWHPASTAEGDFTASVAAYLFPPGRMNEGYGLIFGGRNLDGPDQSYVYFLIRRSGEYLVKRRIGDETETITGWTPDDAIIPYEEDTEGNTHNILSVRVEGDQIHYLVNDVEVYNMPKGDIDTDGIVGLRINHGLNLHIDSFDVEQAG